MGNGATLELSSLPTRHPSVGEALLDSCGGPVIVRLSIDPTPQPPGTLSREVEVNWLRKGRVGSEEQVVRRIGWSDQEGRRKACEQLSIARNAEYLSEGAAIGIAALLIHDLEGGVLQNVLPIGSGGDYLVRVAGEDGFIQLEVSGLRVDETGSLSGSRLKSKTDQVLSHARIGFVSVTTFCYGPRASIHSYQHFVSKRGRNAGRRGPRKKPGGGGKGRKK